ncbi:MAG TPA: DUF6599 family protein [bacterium]
MKSKVLLISFLFIFSIHAFGDVILPDDNFVIGWTTCGRSLVFNKNDLFNYIDGGAELFLEFGFKQLTVQNYKHGEYEVSLEVYEMESPTSALGAYLMKCGEETSIEGIPVRNTGNKYQFTMVKGNCFVQINSFSGNERLTPVLTSLAQASLKFIAETKPVKIFDDLPKDGLIPGSELIVRGPYALQPIYTFGDGDILQLQGEIFGVTADYRDSDHKTYSKLVIKYPTKVAALSAFQNLAKNLDSYSTILSQSETGFIFKDFQKKYGEVKLSNSKLEIHFKLSQKPGEE